MREIATEPYRLAPGRTVRLNNWPTRTPPVYRDKKHYKKQLRDQVERLSELQSRHYAANQHAVLVIFQAMDAAGKDGAIKHVMSGVNPQGVQVHSFKHPSATELQHDFLWRTTAALPERGQITIFNRSYYEEVLIVRVHAEILAAQNLPRVPGRGARSIWSDRFASIKEHEAHLHRNGTRVVKIFLHVSKDEQRRRFIRRIDDRSKNWKFSAGDVKERGFWEDYRAAYEACLGRTSTDDAPWYIVPADDKKNARLIVSEVIVDTLAALKPAYPKLTEARIAELRALKRTLG